VQQHARDFIFSLNTIIRCISGVMTFFPGDLIATGTPAGVGLRQADDTVEFAIRGLRILKNTLSMNKDK